MTATSSQASTERRETTRTMGRVIESKKIRGRVAYLYPDSIGQDASLSFSRLRQLAPGTLDLREWMAERNIEMFDMSHTDSFMIDQIENGYFGEGNKCYVTKKKVDTLRLAVAKECASLWKGWGHYEGTGKSKERVLHADYWQGPDFKASFDGFWVAWKDKSLQIDAPAGKPRGVINREKVEKVKANMTTATCTHCQVDRHREMRDAITVIFGACLRKTEFFEIRNGDYNPETKVLKLRVNKAATANRSVALFSQRIDVGYEPARAILERRQSETLYGQPLFPRKECPEDKIVNVIRMTVVKERWDVNLCWSFHALRHGGAQYYYQIQEQRGVHNVSEKQLVRWTHMSIMTLRKYYGIELQERSEKAKKQLLAKTVPKWVGKFAQYATNTATPSDWSQFQVPDSDLVTGVEPPSKKEGGKKKKDATDWSQFQIPESDLETEAESPPKKKGGERKKGATDWSKFHIPESELGAVSEPPPKSKGGKKSKVTDWSKFEVSASSTDDETDSEDGCTDWSACQVTCEEPKAKRGKRNR